MTSRVLRQAGHWKLSHAQLWNGRTLADEKFVITHPTREAEYFQRLDQAEARFNELVTAE